MASVGRAVMLSRFACEACEVAGTFRRGVSYIVSSRLLRRTLGIVDRREYVLLVRVVLQEVVDGVVVGGAVASGVEICCVALSRLLGRRFAVASDWTSSLVLVEVD